MSECKIAYKGKEYTREEFLNYYDAHEAEFATEVKSPKVSQKTIGKVREFLNRIGVSEENLLDSVRDNDGNKLGINGVTNILDRLVSVVQGEEDQALPEEAAHMAVAIIEVKNPTLFNQMLNRVNKYKAYQSVIESPFYQKQYGKDIRSLKKEAIGQVIAQTINQIDNNGDAPELVAQSQNWWFQIKEFLKGLFGKAEFNPFNTVASSILNNDNIGTIEDINNSNEVTSLAKRIIQKEVPGIFGAAIQGAINRNDNLGVISMLKQQLIDPDTYNTVVKDYLDGDEELAQDILNYQDKLYQENKRDKSFDDLIQKSKLISKVEPNEGDSYYMVDGKKVPNRVTDYAKKFYERTFGNKGISKSEYQKAIDDVKKERGIAGHKDLENAFHTLVDESGFLRSAPMDDSNYKSEINPSDRSTYELLKKNLYERLKTFPINTRFASELMIYDKNRNECGTIDLLAIDPNGKTSILDWKFMELNTDRYEDVPWYKVRAWRIQIGEYKRILKDVYNIPLEDFEQTRAIPIQAIYKYGNYSKNELPVLQGVKIGDVSVKNETVNYLLPVGLEEETTGSEELDSLLRKLNKIYDRISDRKAPENDRKSKAEQLNSLYTAIRQLQMRRNLQPLVYQANLMNTQVENLLRNYENNIKPKASTEFDNDILSAISDEMREYSDILEQYSQLDTETYFLFEDNNEFSPEDAEMEKEIGEAAKKARYMQLKLSKAFDEFTEQKIAGKLKITDIFKPERVVKGIQRMFAATSEIPLRTLQALYKLRNEVKHKTDFEASSENEKIESIKKKYDELAKLKGWTRKNYFDILTKKGSNELIDQYNSAFYKDLKNKIAQKDFEWIRKNIDNKAFIEDKEAQYEKEIERIHNQPYHGTEEEVNAEINRRVKKAKKEYDTSPDGLAWYDYKTLKKYPLKLWESNEWANLNAKGNEAAKEFYDYIIKKNNEYNEIGYLGSKAARSFLPYIPRTITERMVFGGNLSLGEEFFKSISIDESSIGYGQFDPLTGEIVNTIPKYFTSNKEGVEYSTDLFRNMSLYNEMAIRYKYLSEIEGQVLALARAEKNKGSIVTSFFGKARYDQSTGSLEVAPSNKENSQLFDDTVKAIIYGQKYIANENFDQVMGKVGTWGKKINEKLGAKIFPENLEGRQYSMNKSIDTMNRFFQQKIFGFNILSPLSNLLGGSFQTIINAGKYFTKNEFIKNEGRLLYTKFNGEDGKKVMAAMDYFMPLTENPGRHSANQLSISKISHESIQDFLMTLMRSSDKAVQYSIFLSMLDNSVIVDGKIENAREYLRNLPEWRGRYSLPENERKGLEKEFENKVKELINKQGVMKLAEVKNDKFVIPGIERNSDSVYKVRHISQNLSKDALGNLTEDEVRKINLTVFGKSLMMFKNWIPRLVDIRTARLKYNSASDAYEWGRMRTFFRVIGNDFFHSAQNLHNILKANEKGVVYLKDLYQKKANEHYRETGEKLNMTEDQFIDLVRQNIKSQMRDFVFLASLMGMFLAANALPPDKDEDPRVKSAYRFMLRATDKVSDEVAFFYSPLAFQQILNGSIFPSLGMITDIARLTQHFGGYMFDLAIGDDEKAKTKHPLKYLMKSFPVSNQMSSYLPMMFPDLAKDLGIQISGQSRLH